jgi:hypothetical protein
VLTLVHVVFKELRKVRVAAEHASETKDLANDRYLWAVLQAHRVQREFIECNFFGHPRFHPQMVKFILEHMVPRNELERLTTACRDVSGLPARISTLERSVDNMRTRLVALERKGGGGGGGRGNFRRGNGGQGQDGVAELE